MKPNAVVANVNTIPLDADAELAFRSFNGHVWQVCRNAPEDVRYLGLVAAQSYHVALGMAAGEPLGPAWREFVRAVWKLLTVLDRYPSHASWRWRDARGSLIRIVVENVDLLESQTAI